VKRFCLLFCLCLAVGCGPYLKTPDPPKPLNAASQGQEYLLGIATAFETAAISFENHEPAIKINETLGDQQKAARLKAFTPLMAELTATRPKSAASDSEREAADTKSAELLRKWASQLREVAK